MQIKEEVKKNIEKLNATVRELNLKRLKLESGNTGLFNRNVGLQEKIAQLTKDRDALIGENKETQENLKKTKCEVKEEIVKLTVKQNECEQAIDKEITLRDKNTKDLEAIKARSNKVAEEENALKKKKAEYAAQLAKLDQEKAGLADKEDEIASIRRELNDGIARNEARNKTILERLSEAEELKKKNEALLIETKAKNTSADNLLQEADGIKKAILAKEKSIADELARQKEITASITKEQDRLDSKERELNGREEHLNRRETEIEIKDLRIQKLIKDNNLQKELERLKKEVNGK